MCTRQTFHHGESLCSDHFLTRSLSVVGSVQLSPPPFSLAPFILLPLPSPPSDHFLLVTLLPDNNPCVRAGERKGTRLKTPVHSTSKESFPLSRPRDCLVSEEERERVWRFTFSGPFSPALVSFLQWKRALITFNLTNLAENMRGGRKKVEVEGRPNGP